MQNGRAWILFDVGGVLEIVDDDAWHATLLDAWSLRAGLSTADARARLGAAALPPLDVVTGVEPEYWQGVGRALGADVAAVARMRAEFWDAYCGAANTELIEYARSLRERAGVAILSNSADGAREEEERRFAFSQVFDPICYSHEQGVRKPDPRAYELALGRMAAAPDSVLFVDDRQEAIDGAARCGIRGALHRDNATTIATIEDFLGGP